MNKKEAGYKEGIISIVINTVLFGLKFWAGIVSGSIALVADAWHTLSDSFSSVIVIAGTKLSDKKPDKDHPFGHGRWEQIASIFIAVVLSIIAYEFVKDAIQRLQEGESANFGMLAVVVTILSILVKEALAQYAFYLGKKSGNLTVKADGWHHRSDALSSIIVLIGILLKDFFWWIDSALGIIIALMLFYASYEIIKEAINKLLGETPSEELKQEIRDIITFLYKTDFEPHHFHIHNYNSQQELTFHIKLEPEIDILHGHQIATDIENKIFEDLKIISTIHIEPIGNKHKFD